MSHCEFSNKGQCLHAHVLVINDLLVAAELGDYNEVELDSGFTNDLDLMPKLASSMEDKILNAFRDLRSAISNHKL